MKKTLAILALTSICSSYTYALVDDRPSYYQTLDNYYKNVKNLKKIYTDNETKIVWYYSTSSIKPGFYDFYPDNIIKKVDVKIVTPNKGYSMESINIDCTRDYVEFASRFFYYPNGVPMEMKKQSMSIYSYYQKRNPNNMGLNNLKNIVCN